MKYFLNLVTLIVTVFGVSLFGLNFAMAATAPNLGAADSFSILAQTAITGTGTISGDVEINGPGANISALTTAMVAGTMFSSDAGTTGGTSPTTLLDSAVQADASAAFFSGIPGQPTNGSIGPVLDGLTVTPGVWDIGAGKLNGGILTLDGPGVYIFRASSDLISSGSIVLINGASASDVYWRVETLATINGTSFTGTILAGTGIHFGNGVALNGRALAIGGDVTLLNNTIYLDIPATLHIIKNVINDDGRTLTAADFSLSVKLAGVNVTGSPAVGVGTPGTLYTLPAGTYVVSEITTTTYTQTFSGDCDVDGNVILGPGENKTCTIINNDVAPVVLPTTSTITVIKVVVNDSGRNKVIADFPLFVNGNPVVAGVPTVFPAPATYTVTETVDPNYTQSFSLDCPGGIVSLTTGIGKTCIITNNDNVIPSGGGSNTPPPVPPLINVLKTASPLSLPAGPGLVAYTYTLSNIGTVPVTDVTMVGDTCSPINLISGDTNSDAKLDVNEIWVYRCSATINETHTNVITATGWANGISAVDIASATVVVGVPVIPPLINVTKVPSPVTFPFAGGLVTYTMKVTNPGEVALSNIIVTDDKCSSLGYVSGDINVNSRLDVGETWTYTCQANLTQTITNTVTATGEANGLTARDIAVATVVVAAAPIVVPTLPKTGLSTYSVALGLIGLIAIIAVVAVLLVVTFRKKIV